MVFENLEGTICFLLQNGALNPILFAGVCKVISVFESTIMTVGRKCLIFCVYDCRLNYLYYAHMICYR